MPGNQPASPNIVINEIQHSPTGGDTAEFVELYNPQTQAIDLSGWTITGGIDLDIQPGTVILPAADDDVRQQRPRLPQRLRRHRVRRRPLRREPRHAAPRSP